jgi:hypothetical protein
MEPTNAQQMFFQHIKGKLPPHISIADAVAELLNISTDSAYRRIRGDKPISFEELQKLCLHYRVSLDQFLNLESDNFIFFGKINRDSGFAFMDWLEEVLRQYSMISSFEKKHIYFLLKDLPFNLHFRIPELAAFKCFVWMKFFSDYDPDKEMKFTFNYPGFEKHYAIGQKIVDVYNTIPTTELWNTEAINTTIRQIEYYYESGNIISKEQAFILFEKVEELINHIEKEAELGFKYTMGVQPVKALAEYRLFNNELRLGDNGLLAEMGDMKVAFVNHSYMHFIGTKDEAFCKAMSKNLNNQINKATLISTSGERERVKFFNLMREEIRQRKVALL